jgi:hypothetical protein
MTQSVIANIVKLRFLNKVGRFDDLDNARYVCLASYEFVKQISNDVDFDLGAYLYDFV